MILVCLSFVFDILFISFMFRMYIEHYKTGVYVSVLLVGMQTCVVHMWYESLNDGVGWVDESFK